MKYRVCLISIVSLLVNFVNGQDKLYNEKVMLKNRNASDSSKMAAAYNISKEICFIYPDSGIYFGKLAYKYAMKAKAAKGEASSLSQVGYSFALQDQIDSALVYWHRSAEKYNSIKDEFNSALIKNNIAGQYIFMGEYQKAKGMLDSVETTMIRLDSSKHNLGTYTNLGLIYDMQGDYIEGQKYYMKAFQLANSNRDTSGMINNLINISVMYYYLDNFENAIKYSREALQYGNTKKYQSQYAKIYLNMAVSFEKLHQIDSSILYNGKSLVLYIALKNDFGIAKCYHNLGCLYTDQGDLSKGLANLIKAKEIKEKMPNRESIATTILYLGRVFTLKKDYKQALVYLNKGQTIATEMGVVEEVMDAQHHFAQYYEATGDYKNAFYSLKKFMHLHDSIQSADIKVKIADLDIRYTTAKIDAENVMLKIKQSEDESRIIRHKKMLYITLGGILLLSILLWIIYRQKENQRKLVKDIQKRNEQIQLLNHEINHRVKNNIGFMTALLEMQGRRTKNEETRELLLESEMRLKTLELVHSDLFNNERTSEVNLRTYLSELTSHLENIYAIPNKFLNISASYIDYDINAEDAMRFGLIINELVTNSVKHAFHDVANPEIRILTYMDSSGKLTLEYHDNGPGVKFNIEENQPGRTSLGMKLISLLTEQLSGGYVIVV